MKAFFLILFLLPLFVLAQSSKYIATNYNYLKYSPKTKNWVSSKIEEINCEVYIDMEIGIISMQPPIDKLYLIYEYKKEFETETKTIYSCNVSNIKQGRMSCLFYEFKQRPNILYLNIFISDDLSVTYELFKVE
jgi:hypothetical protein